MIKIIVYKVRQQIRRLIYFIKHGEDGYGKPGFDRIMFQGKEVEMHTCSQEIWDLYIDKQDLRTKK